MSFKSLIFKFRRPLIIAVHLVLVICAYILAFCLRFDCKIDVGFWQTITKTLPILICVKIAWFAYFGLFSGLWRYVGVDDIWRIIKANVLSTAVFVAGVAFLFPVLVIPRSVFILDCMLCFCMMAGIRFFNRMFREAIRPAPMHKRKRAVIIGAGGAGLMVLRETRANPKSNIEIIGFIDDDRNKKGLRIQGVRILGASSDIATLFGKYGVDEAIIAIPSASGKVIRNIVSHCQKHPVKIRIVPGLQKIISGELEIRHRDIKPEDLLGRETVKIDEKDIKEYLSGRVVLITGAGGSIGSALCRQIINYAPKEILLFDHNENDVYYLGIDFLTNHPKIKFRTIIGDIKDVALLKSVFSLYRPQVIFHAAAHKHVPLMEENPVAAVKNNIIGSRNFIYAANHYKVERFILISTDKAVNPTSVMGITKRIAEMTLQSKAKISKTKFMAVRFGNVLGSDGSVVPLFKKQIEEGGPLTITHPEVKRYFMSVNEASQLVLQAGGMGKSGEIFILDMGEQIKILDLAKELIALYGLDLEEDIKIKFIGLRPGEKLFEETLLNSEKDKATKADKIYIAQSDYFDSRVLRRKIKELEEAASLMDAEGVIRKMREIIKL